MLHCVLQVAWYCTFLVPPLLLAGQCICGNTSSKCECWFNLRRCVHFNDTWSCEVLYIAADYTVVESIPLNIPKMSYITAVWFQGKDTAILFLASSFVFFLKPCFVVSHIPWHKIKSVYPLVRIHKRPFILARCFCQLVLTFLKIRN